jgi:hypothetical protein
VADPNVAEIDQPVLLIAILVAAAGQFGHGSMKEHTRHPLGKSSIPCGSKRCRTTARRGFLDAGTTGKAARHSTMARQRGVSGHRLRFFAGSCSEG